MGERRSVLVNFVYCHPVGHAIEALHYCHGYHRADPGLRIGHRASAFDNPAVRPVLSASARRSTSPACDTTPRPSAVTSRPLDQPVATAKVLLDPGLIRASALLSSQFRSTCCYSGAFTTAMRRRSAEPPRVDVSNLFDGSGRVVITASTSLQYAHERAPDVLLSRNQAHPSVFTAAIVRGLRDGTADLDGDGLISVNELYDYVLKEVQHKVPGQTPTMSVDNVQGTIYIARGMPSPDTNFIAELRSCNAPIRLHACGSAVRFVCRVD